MNLMHLLAKNDRNLILGSGVVKGKWRVASRVYTGLIMPAGEAGEVRVRTALRWHPFRLRPHSTEWLAMRLPGARGAGAPGLKVSFVDPSGATVAALSEVIGAVPGIVGLPHLPAPASLARDHQLDLVLTNVSDEPISLLVTEAIPPELVYDQAVGVGAELGPGPNPRLINTAERKVSYVEREPVEAWAMKYSHVGKLGSLNSPEAQALWSQYTVGRAHDLPFDEGSLDFLFSAHVFEHLVNPLGHLAYWRTKLRPGGCVLAIVPYISGCSDYVNMPTPFRQWVLQYEEGGFDERVEHYEAFASARGQDPRDLFDRKLSYHFSFFDMQNVSETMSFAVSELGYSGYNIYYGRNGKSFYFALYN